MDNYYDWIARIYDATRPLPQVVSEQVTDCILHTVAATPKTTFLEPGIGTGRTSLPIIQRGYSYTGIDISKEMMDELRRKLGGVPGNLTLLQADASSLPFEDDSFDVVLTTHMLQCLPDWLLGLAEIRRVLKPNGIYLACENLLTPHQREFEQQLRAILAQHQQGSQKTAQQKSDQSQLNPFKEGITQVLTEQDAVVKTVTAAQWRVEETVEGLLNKYQSKAIGLCWTVPDDVFTKVMYDFRERCQKHYGSFALLLASNATFEIAVARDWKCAAQRHC